MICATCPWRVGAEADAIPHFSECKARGLVNTDGPDDGFRTIMACHLSKEGEERACGGYVVSDSGWRNLAVRMAAIDGRIDLAALQAEAEGLDLHGTVEEMLDGLGVAW